MNIILPYSVSIASAIGPNGTHRIPQIHRAWGNTTRDLTSNPLTLSQT